MTQAGNEDQYQFREQPPTPAVVEALILELFQGKLTERKVIADEVLRVHLSRGGAKPRAQFEGSFRKALLTMKDAGLAENPTQGYWHIHPRNGQKVSVQAPITPNAEEVDCDITSSPEVPISPQIETVADTVLGQGSGAIYLYYLPAYRLRAEEHGEKTWPCKIGRTDRDPLARVLSQAGTALPERPHLALVIRTDYPSAWESALHGVLTLRGLRIDDLPGSEWFLTSPAEVLALVHVFNPQFAERMQSENVVIKLDPEETLVLFEMLSRWSNDGAPVQVADPGEEVALNGLLALLEKQLVDPFRSDYRERVAQALSVLRERGGVA